MKAKEARQSGLCQSGNGDGDTSQDSGEPLESETPFKLRYRPGPRVTLRSAGNSSTTGASALVLFEF